VCTSFKLATAEMLFSLSIHHCFTLAFHTALIAFMHCYTGNKHNIRPQQLGHVLLSNVEGAASEDDGALTMYVGHLPEFDLLQQDIRGTNDPARQLALVGLDLLAHTRLVISVKSKKFFFKAKELNDVWAGQIV
jgi:hypothetical protein